MHLLCICYAPYFSHHEQHFSRCENSSSEFEKSLGKLKTVSEMTSLLNVTCPPEAPITLGWMKTKLDSVSLEISSHKSRKTQAINAVTTKRVSDTLSN
jgi:hypothetical protein